jgi:hypothetical protein
MKKLILLLSVLLVVSCNDRPDCINTNEIFNKYSPNIKEYKDKEYSDRVNIQSNRILIIKDNDTIVDVKSEED